MHFLHLLANSVDPDQMPRFAASELGLHCLPMSQKWDARLIWVNSFSFKTLFKGNENLAMTWCIVPF